MLAEKWTIDNVTHLFRSADGFRIRWAGAFFGPCENLEELAEGELLNQCRELITTTGTQTELADCDSMIGDSFTVEIGR